MYQSIVSYHWVTDGAWWEVARGPGAWLLLILGMALCPTVTPVRYISIITAIFRILLLLTVLAVIVNPEAALQNDPIDNYLPGTSMRLTGVAENPNGMGGLAATSVLLELYGYRRQKRWVNWNAFCLLVSASVLLLTQSKSALVGCIIVAMYLIAARKGHRAPVLTTMLIATSAIVSIGSLYWDAISSRVTEYSSAIATLTGRTVIWNIYWDMAWQQPWFGHGTGLWDHLRDSMFRYHFAIGNAHNQMLQSFLITGLVGLGLWFLYVAALLRSAVRVDTSARHLYIGLLSLLLFRCFTEAPLSPGTYNSLQNVLLGFIFCVRHATLLKAPVIWDSGTSLAHRVFVKCPLIEIKE